MDAKVVRIPTEVKAALDKAKPPGIELWKWTADVLLVGLSVLEKMKGNKEFENILRYDMANLLANPIGAMGQKKEKAGRG